MSKQKKTAEGQALDLLKKYIPLDDKAEMESINLKFQQLFKYHPPDYDEKRKICQVNKESIKKLGNQLLEKHGITDKIPESIMYRCISKNLALFKYIIVTMEKTQHSQNIIQYVLKPAPKPLPVPMINTSDQETANKEKNTKEKAESTADKDKKSKDKDQKSKNTDSTNKSKDLDIKDKNTTKQSKPSTDEDNNKPGKTTSKDDGTQKKDTTNKDKIDVIKGKDQEHDAIFLFDDNDNTFLSDDNDFGHFHYEFSPF